MFTNHGEVTKNALISIDCSMLSKAYTLKTLIRLSRINCFSKGRAKIQKIKHWDVDVYTIIFNVNIQSGPAEDANLSGKASQSPLLSMLFAGLM